VAADTEPLKRNKRDLEGQFGSLNKELERAKAREESLKKERGGK
jgi:hypothetical protein